jgi:hypothetical protein
MDEDDRSANTFITRESSLTSVLHKSFVEVNRSFERWFTSKKVHTPLKFSSGDAYSKKSRGPS